MNIEEGKGRYSKKEFIHHLYIARGSLYESLTPLEIFLKQGWIKNVRFNQLKETTRIIAKKINALIKSLKSRSPDPSPNSHEPALEIAPDVPVVDDAAGVWHAPVAGVVIATPAETHYDLKGRILMVRLRGTGQGAAGGEHLKGDGEDEPLRLGCQAFRTQVRRV